MPHVLIVDDDLEGCEPVVRALERAGHHATCCANGRDALAAMVGQSWDVAILDVRMPEMDGIKLLEVIRSYLRWHAKPVILLTAHLSPEQEATARAAGVRHVFRKAGYELPDLLAAVAQAAATPR